jgi:hypothetical protein
MSHVFSIPTKPPPVATSGMSEQICKPSVSLIPFAPAIPGVTIILVGLGITARDGLVLGLAMLVMGWDRGVA